MGFEVTYEQTSLFMLFGTVFVLLIWGKIRYDLVAFTALILGVLLGVVDTEDAFSGFGHEAVVIIALVLIVSRGLTNSGAIELAASRILSSERGISAHIGVMASVGASLSAIINNVAALALLMPLDVEAARKARRAISQSLMPLSFASILGGMITMIGTPPNIVIAKYRDDALGAPFNMFDFTPVGFVVAISGIAFITLVGWRLIPSRGGSKLQSDEANRDRYVSELRVPERCPWIDQQILDLYPLGDEHDVNILGLVRGGRRRPGFASSETLTKGDFLVVEGAPKAIEAFMGAAKLDFAGSEKHNQGITSGSLSLMEAIVTDTSRISYRSAMRLRLLYRQGVTLLGVSRQGERFHERVRRLTIEPGDVLLLLGTSERLESVATWLNVLPLEGRRTEMVQRNKARFAVATFIFALFMAVLGFADLTIALAGCAIVFVATGLVNGTEVYECIEWKVLVLLASLIPLGQALDDSGGAALIANLLLTVTSDLPAWAILGVLMLITMTLSDFLNNVATCLIAAPVGLQIAEALGRDPDPFLMGVAVAASCAFLTPIGHKNNTIIMGPGGYHFGDYWRMGLPLEIIVIAVSLPAILVFWPL